VLFTALEFLLYFLPLSLAGFFAIARWSRRGAAIWLGFVSLVFYGAWDWTYVPLLLGSIAGNYLGGLVLARLRADPRAGALLAGFVAANLLLLGWCKYVGFFAANLPGGAPDWIAGIALPLGISFFTFTQIAYLVDVRRGLAREADLPNYVLFVTFFPHLIAGPLLHHRQMMPQFDDPTIYRPQVAFLTLGLFVFAVGLAKKVLLADGFADYATPIFDGARDGVPLGAGAAWVAAFAYAFQIYFDFSGYSDMAIGLGLLFGIRLPENFAAPYRAAGPIEFWRRWHMTLSAFLRDYLYIPLGGNRHGPARRHMALLVTMLLGGLWHGANWTFVVWGAIHGLWLAAAHLWQARRQGAAGGPPRALAVATTFLLVTLAWVPFRADSLSTAWAFYAAMADPLGAWVDISRAHDAVFAAFQIAPGGGARLAVLFALAAAVVWLCPTTARLGERYARLPPAAAAATAGAALVAIGVLAAIAASRSRVEFIYFNF
jgi:alginate O-acetyltransferase complex protein AlgI